MDIQPERKNLKIVHVACLGAWHKHAFDFSDRILANPNADLIAVWDPDPERGKDWANRYNCEFVGNLNELLGRKDIDAVTVTCKTTDHFKIIKTAATAGKHIYVEKPPFITYDESIEAGKVIKEKGLKFMIGSPLVKPMHLKTLDYYNSGLLGEMVGLRYRTVHELGYLGKLEEAFFDPQQNGGGAMFDMGNHGIHLLSWFGGKEDHIKTIYTSHTNLAQKYGVDDNDISVIEFQNGVLGSMETGWITPWYQYGFDFYGSKGSVSCRAYEMFVCFEDGIWKKISNEELPSAEKYPLDYWIDCIRNDQTVERDDINIAESLCLAVEKTEQAAKEPMRDYLKPDRFNIIDDKLTFAKSLVNDKALGEIKNIRVHCGGKENSYQLNMKAKAIIEVFIGDAIGEKRIVSANGNCSGKSITSLLKYKDKCLGIAEGNSLTPEYEDGIDICGTEGMVRIRGNELTYTETKAGDRNAIWKPF